MAKIVLHHWYSFQFLLEMLFFRDNFLCYWLVVYLLWCFRFCSFFSVFSNSGVLLSKVLNPKSRRWFVYEVIVFSSVSVPAGTGMHQLNFCWYLIPGVLFNCFYSVFLGFSLFVWILASFALFGAGWSYNLFLRTWLKLPREGWSYNRSSNHTIFFSQLT